MFVDDYYCIGSAQCNEELLAKLDSLMASGGDNTTINKPTEVSPYQILGLAAVDAVNPCALAVLTLILVSILVQNPDRRNKVLRIERWEPEGR